MMTNLRDPEIYGYLFMVPHLINTSLTVNLNYRYTFRAATQLVHGFYFLHFPYLHLGTKKIIYSQPKTELAGQHDFFFSYQQMAAVTRNVKTAMTAPTC